MDYSEKNEMEIDIFGYRISGKSFWHAKKIIIKLKSGKSYELYVKDGDLVKEEKEAE